MTDIRTHEPSIYGTISGWTCAWTLTDGYDCSVPACVQITALSPDGETPDHTYGACRQHAGVLAQVLVDE